MSIVSFSPYASRITTHPSFLRLYTTEECPLALGLVEQVNAAKWQYTLGNDEDTTDRRVIMETLRCKG